jgi:threonine dehydrogenase-like Zn-dependent dehydrogenase
VSDLRVAVLGLGMMGAFHVDLLSTAVKGVTITVVNDFVQAKADEVAARIGARVVADPIEGINDSEVDAVRNNRKEYVQLAGLTNPVDEESTPGVRAPDLIGDRP